MSKISIQAIVFDFDGVLAESVTVKGDAFFQLYEHAGLDIQNKVLEYHLAHGGVSRFDKIHHYESEFMGRPVTEEEMLKIADRFSDLVEQKVVESDWVNGAKDFLDDALSKEFPMFVASATPQEELERIVESRGMTKYFKGVFGSPTPKAEHILAVMDQYGYDQDKVVMIGDTISDYKAAQSSGVQFIGRHIPDVSFPFPEGTVSMKDLATLEDLIEF